MKKIVLTLFVNIICVCSYSQGIYIKGDGYKGFVFSKEHKRNGFPSQENYFTPSFEEIEKAERILKEYFRNNSYNISSEYPSVNTKTLKKYFRQYTGELTEKGDKVITIYFIHKKEKNVFPFEEMKKDLVNVFDGGTYYWKIFIDITSSKVTKMSVNGIV